MLHLPRKMYTHKTIHFPCRSIISSYDYKPTTLFVTRDPTVNTPNPPHTAGLLHHANVVVMPPPLSPASCHPPWMIPPPATPIKNLSLTESRIVPSLALHTSFTRRQRRDGLTFLPTGLLPPPSPPQISNGWHG